MRKVVFERNALDDFEFWTKQDIKILKKIAELILAINKEPFSGIGKPEPLKGDLKGYWSRRITDEHRIVYTITADAVIIISCKSHYKI